MINNQHIDCQHCMDASCATAVLRESELQLLSENCHEGDISRHEIILQQGSLSSQIIYLRSGLVKEYLKQPTLKPSIVQIIKRQSYIGLHSLFSGQVNQYGYSALTDCKVCFIDSRVFRSLIKTNGRFASEILTSVCIESLNSHHRFLNLHQKQTYGKVADLLIYLAQIIHEDINFELVLSREDLASMIGISRESVSRILQNLQDEDIIEASGRRIQIKDMERLERISRAG